MVMPKGDWKPAVVFAALTLTFFSISGYFYQNGFPDFGYSFLGLAVTALLASGFSAVAAATASAFVEGVIYPLRKSSES